jgi:hypothetical protein
MNRPHEHHYMPLTFPNIVPKEGKSTRYVNIATSKPISYPPHRWLKLEFPADDTTFLRQDNSIIISPEICKKLNWKIGSKLWIDVYDENLSQIIVGKELSGEEAVRGMGRLKQIIKGEE